MNLDVIYQAIAKAKSHEVATHQLEVLVEKHLPVIHPLIELPNDEPAKALVEFISDYIDYVPALMEAVDEGARIAGIEDHVKPLLNIASAYFESPPETLVSEHGLHAIMDEAYLAHRLIEEVNDVYLANAGMPLIPMDTVMANVIVHNLIGEPFANELDAIVHQAVQQMMIKEKVYVDNHFQIHLDNRKKHELVDTWPCFTENSNVSVGLKGAATKNPEPVD